MDSTLSPVREQSTGFQLNTTAYLSGSGHTSGSFSTVPREISKGVYDRRITDNSLDQSYATISRQASNQIKYAFANFPGSIPSSEFML